MKKNFLILLPFLAVIGAALFGTLGPPLPCVPAIRWIQMAKQWETTHLSGLLPVVPLILAAWTHRRRQTMPWRTEVALFLIILYLASLAVGWVGFSEWLFPYSDHFCLKMATASLLAGSVLMAQNLGPLDWKIVLFVIVYSLSDFLLLAATARHYHTSLEVFLGIGVGALLIFISHRVAKGRLSHV